MKFSMIILSSVLVFGTVVRAQENIFNSSMNADPVASIIEFSQILNHLQFQSQTVYPLSNTTVADDCKTFISKELFLGEVGSYVHKTILANGQAFPHLLEGGSLKTTCQKYPTMTLQQKSLVWVLILTVVAHFESSCSLAAHAKGPNGTAYGYFQLHKGEEQNYDGNRGVCRKNASLSAEKSVQCTLSMLDVQFEKNNGQLFNPNSYWDVLRPHGQSRKAALIHAALAKSSFCNSQMM